MEVLAAGLNSTTSVKDQACCRLALKAGDLQGILYQRNMHVRLKAPAHQQATVHTGQAPVKALADARYFDEKNLEGLSDSGAELVVALGRGGKRCAQINALENPHTAAMADKLQTEQSKAAH
jgi:hypothetical protein